MPRPLAVAIGGLLRPRAQGPSIGPSAHTTRGIPPRPCEASVSAAFRALQHDGQPIVTPALKGSGAAPLDGHHLPNQRYVLHRPPDRVRYRETCRSPDRSTVLRYRTELTNVMENFRIVDPEDDDSGWLNDDRPNEVSGIILDRIAPATWSCDRFGDDYAKSFFPKKEMAFYINLLFDRPCVDLGIKFDPFTIPEDAVSADHCGELLSPIENLSDRRCFYMEVNIEDEDEHHPWHNIRVDDSYLARFIPLLKVDEGTALFHAPHLYDALDHLFKIEGVAALFEMPHGPSAQLLHLARL